MQPVDFFCSRMDAMIHLNDPLTMLVTELACNKIQRAIAKKLEHQNRLSQVLYDEHHSWASLSGRRRAKCRAQTMYPRIQKQSAIADPIGLSAQRAFRAKRETTKTSCAHCMRRSLSASAKAKATKPHEFSLKSVVVVSHKHDLIFWMRVPSLATGMKTIFRALCWSKLPM